MTYCVLLSNLGPLSCAEHSLQCQLFIIKHFSIHWKKPNLRKILLYNKCEFPQIFSEIIKFLYNLNYKMQVKIEITTPCGYRAMPFKSIQIWLVS